MDRINWRRGPDPLTRTTRRGHSRVVGHCRRFGNVYGGRGCVGCGGGGTNKDYGIVFERARRRHRRFSFLFMSWVGRT